MKETAKVDWLLGAVLHGAVEVEGEGTEKVVIVVLSLAIGIVV